MNDYIVALPAAQHETDAAGPKDTQVTPMRARPQESPSSPCVSSMVPAWLWTFNLTLEQEGACAYRPGDWIIVRSNGRDLVGQVVKVHDVRPHHMLQICRYLSPEETVHRPSQTFWPNEVFKCKETSYHPCCDTVSRSFVLHRSQFVVGRPKAHLWDPATPIFLCESRYSSDLGSRNYTQITNWKPIDANDIEPFSAELHLSKLPSPFLRGIMGPGRLLTDAEINAIDVGEQPERAHNLRDPSKRRPSKRTQPPELQSNMSTPPSAKRPRQRSVGDDNVGVPDVRLHPRPGSPMPYEPAQPPAQIDLPSVAAASLGFPLLPIPEASTSASIQVPPSLPPPPAETAAAEDDAPELSSSGVPLLNPSNDYVGRPSKPPYSYASLIAQAIYNAPGGRARLEQIYEFIMAAYPFYRTAGPSWQNMLRHNLSLRPAFVKVARVGGSGKGSWWTLDLSKEPGGFDGTTFGTRRQVAAGNRKLAEAEGRDPPRAWQPKHSKAASSTSGTGTGASKQSAGHDQGSRSGSTSSTSSSASSIATPASHSLPLFTSNQTSRGPPRLTVQGGYAALSHLPAPLPPNRQLGKTSSGEACALDLMASVCSIISLGGGDEGDVGRG